VNWRPRYKEGYRALVGPTMALELQQEEENVFPGDSKTTVNYSTIIPLPGTIQVLFHYPVSVVRRVVL